MRAYAPPLLLAVTVVLFWAYFGPGPAVLAFVSHVACWVVARDWDRISPPSPSARPRAGAD